jgi:transposase InsO family protein
MAAPNMNAFTERVIGSIRREALDHFLLFSEKQVRTIIGDYVEYYNHQRLHQGTGSIPISFVQSDGGIIKKGQILGGLHHHYYQSSA